ncbi:MAG: hypothetical protein R3F62_20610 [Planctomycetota bacterium]
MSSKKRLALFLAVFVGGALWFGLPFARALRYRNDCQLLVDEVARDPVPEGLFALPERARALAPAAGIDPAVVRLEVGLRRLGLPEAPRYRVELNMVHGPWDDRVVAGIDGQRVDLDYLEALVEGGVELRGMAEESAELEAR